MSEIPTTAPSTDAADAQAEENAVRYETDGGVATITLNRPERRNAINQALTDQLGTALRRARADEAVRCIVLAGAGEGFCAGADVSAFENDWSVEDVRDYIAGTYQPLMRTFLQMKKPIVGAVNGVAAGAGLSLALACDLRVMADDASLLMAFVNLGIAPDAGASWFMARQVGYSRALELAIEGERLSAARCEKLGLTNRVVPAAELQEAAQEWAAHLAERPTLAVGLTKQTMMQAMTQDLMDTIAHEAELQMQAFASHDHREGLQAFAERRAPDFEGR